MAKIELIVPDIGDFHDVPVAEIFVQVGDRINLEQAVASIESDKATMDIPSPVAGKILSLNVSVGDRVSTGSLLGLIETDAVNAPATTGSERAATIAAPGAGRSTAAVAPSGGDFDLVVIGGGPGGYSAAFRAADLGLKVALVETRAQLGGVCLNVGCIPSKALLHVAAVKEEAGRLATHGITFGPPQVDLNALRDFKKSTVKRLTDGLDFMAKMRKVQRITGTGQFTAPNRIEVVLSSGGALALQFKSCIIAAGSSPIALSHLPDDPRIVDSTGALELPLVPERMLVVGGGIIGLEMATVYSALGARVDVVEQTDLILNGVDRDLVAIWMKQNARRFDRVMIGTRLEAIDAKPDKLTGRFSGDAADGDYDLVLQAAGRRPNGANLSLEAAGLTANNGFIKVDRHMRTQVAHIFAIGDIVGQPMLAHKAVHEAHVAAEVAAGHKAAFDAAVIPSVAYLDPEIAWVGVTEELAKANGLAIEVAKFPWTASGRAIANSADFGVTKLIFAKETGRIVGGAIIGPNAGDMIGEICLAIEMGADAIDIGRTIHPHPTLGESIGMAAEIAKGTCTDVPPKARITSSVGSVIES
ncbi:dihydrolipoyl dehydrogenase [Bradyrhizobium sp. WSM3983]|uniref:dihydrolipoyl dehydrogenase n=1 Tax=Bradyrhizobium sp. WSM3983 TaxID=1038867 RepID=UPI0004058790|nr:dihydrolipoyl dehydrogenase [Bradyrhizobium sp. WSM3983]